jgi:16S rRNA (cytidine1402-2'-O)-methyltransferase
LSEPAGGGKLVLVATPIGNLGDLSPRAADVLGAADVVCCEDTRHSGQLLARSGVHARRLLSFHGHNEAARVPEVLGLLAGGATVAVVSDAGTPGIADPGARLVAAAAGAGFTVSAVPGPAAFVAAVALSGFETERFSFEAFLPRKGPARRRRIGAVAGADAPVAIYEAPHRLAATLRDLEQACGGERRVVVVRELTKLFEEVWRGTLAEAGARAEEASPRGEHVIVVDRAPAREIGPEEVEAALRSRLAAGEERREAITAVAGELGVPRREVYALALAID